MVSHFLKGKRVFISGPMTGIEFKNAPAFARVHAALKERGVADVYDPSQEWLYERGEERCREYYMRKCLWHLVRMGSNEDPMWDYIVMLDGWEESQGATIERQVAMACGIAVIEEREI